MTMFSWKAFLLIALLIAARPLPADLIRLQLGGELRGTLTTTEPESPTTEIETLSGARVTIERNQIDFVQRRTPLEEEYVSRARVTPDTVEGHWDLAEWCRVNQLADQRTMQLERILDLDTDHADARRILGYVEHLGRWMTKEDMMAERGYLRHDGRWVTRQELALIEHNAAAKEKSLDWMPKVRLWSGWVTSSDPQRQAQGLEQLMHITDPTAITALTKFLSEQPEAGVRTLFVKILAKIPGREAVAPLTRQVLFDSNRYVRQESLTAIGTERYELALPLFLRALRHDSNDVVNRAAAALGEIGDKRAVGPLIEALVTTHSFNVQVPASGISFSNGGTLGNGAFSGILPPSVEVQARTGQLPYGVGYRSDQSTPLIYKTVNVTRDIKNPNVLTALERLTGKNLGFNERDWHLWWAVENG